MSRANFLRDDRVRAAVLTVIGLLAVWWVLDYLIARPIPDLDVSAETQYAPVLGKRFRTQCDLAAIGVTVDRNYRKQIDHIALRRPPGFSGPEVVARGHLPKDSVLEVTGVLRADSWLVDRIRYLVRRVDAAPPLQGQLVLDVNEDATHNFGLPEAEFVLVNGDVSHRLGNRGRDRDANWKLAS
jgi:hypothetical protein